MSDSGYPNLLSPLELGPFELRNRVLVSAHVPGYAVDNKPSAQYIAYHRARAAGGVALQMTGCTAVHRSGLLSASDDGLRNLDDNIVPGYRVLAGAVHQEGGRILAQLGHSGGTVHLAQPGFESWSPSAVRSEVTGAVSHEMSTTEVVEVIEAFGAGASRVAAGDMDGVEILAAFGYLPQAFMSPLTNHRRDRYGGSLDNRLRFTLEVLALVRQRLGADRVLGIRIPGDEFTPGGLTLADMTDIARRLSDSGLVDYLNVIAHTNIGHTGRALHWPPTPAKHGGFVYLASAIRAAVNVPVFAVGRVTDPRHAERVIAAGDADMVGMTRAHISDPDIVKKIRQDESLRIRPCVGANTCIANRYAGKPIRCMHNPSLAEPTQQTAKAAASRRVVVIGAGPAGLEAARIAAERGHEVRVFEAAPHVGGQLRCWSGAPSMGELRAIIDWRVRELARLNVPVELSREITAESLEQLGADVFVMATGARPRANFEIGDGSLAVISASAVVEDVSAVPLGAGKTALVWSDGRGQAGLCAAEALGGKKVTVELVTSDIAVAADLDPTNRTAWYHRLGRLGVKLHARLVVDDVRNTQVVLRDVYTDERTTRNDIGLIVDWRGSIANEALSEPARRLGVEAHCIGDCVAPRTVEVATAEAWALANAL